MTINVIIHSQFINTPLITKKTYKKLYVEDIKYRYEHYFMPICTLFCIIIFVGNIHKTAVHCNLLQFYPFASWLFLDSIKLIYQQWKLNCRYCAFLYNRSVNKVRSEIFEVLDPGKVSIITSNNRFINHIMFLYWKWN